MSIARGQSANQNQTTSTHRVIELFAGVGGFRHGLMQANAERSRLGLPPAFEVVWANQFEPGCKRQHAAAVYQARWGHAAVNRDLFEVLKDPAELDRLDALEPTMLVGGFPCQDYSVAKPASQSHGLEGKKGVLWWGIHKLLELRLQRGKPVELLMLENVDRLISSPSTCRGRDFAIILSSLQALGYAAAWQVINAADYGHAQKRKRVFIVAIHETSEQYAEWTAACVAPDRWLQSSSPLAAGLPVDLVGSVSSFALGGDVLATQQGYEPGARGATRFANAGVCINGRVWTAATKAAVISDFTPFVGQSAALTLGDVVSATSDVSPSYFLDESSVPQWQFLKGAKSIERVSAAGHAYRFSEGAMQFPDPLDRPARTIITSEGGTAPSRTRHVIQAADGRLRRLTPEELEALNGFPRGFTAIPGISNSKRAFLMGNALVTGLVARIGAALVGCSAPAPKPGLGLGGGSPRRSSLPEGLVPRVQVVCHLQLTHGELAEWSIAPVLKTGSPRGLQGSNPWLSATQQNQAQLNPHRPGSQPFAERASGPPPRDENHRSLACGSQSLGLSLARTCAYASRPADASWARRQATCTKGECWHCDAPSRYAKIKIRGAPKSLIYKTL